ncbi:hypothetical protein JCM6882_007307 [Rhodosporidiobolus microsporus]
MPPPYEASTSSSTAPHPYGASSALPPPRSPVLCPPSPTPSMLLPPSPSLGTTRRAPPSPICPPPYCSSSPTLRAPLSPVSVEEMQDDPHYLATPTQRSYFVQLSDLFEETAPAKREEDVEAGRRRKGREMKEKTTAKRARLLVPVLKKGGGQLVDDAPTPRCFGCCTIS